MIAEGPNTDPTRSDPTKSDPGSSSSPQSVAAAIAALSRPTLVVFDCDGVLAPLTDHADDSRLGDGVGDALERLSEVDGVDVAILSGRSLAGLAQFEFADTITVAGSYGGERRGVDVSELTDAEASLMVEADRILRHAVEIAGDGAWIERKPTSLVLHVREADPDNGAAGITSVREAQQSLSGHECHEGSNVLEIMARPADKGRGLDDLRRDLAAASVVYLGDDVPDEDAFARLGAADVGVKVGPGDSRASHRLDDPAAVSAMIHDLIEKTRT